MEVAIEMNTLRSLGLLLAFQVKNNDPGYSGPHYTMAGAYPAIQLVAHRGTIGAEGSPYWIKSFVHLM